MENQLAELIEKAKGNKKGLIMFKNAAVRLQDYELASKLREIETTNFPETEEAKAAKKLAKDLHGAFAMVGLNISEELCYVVHEVVGGFKKKKGKFSLRDSAAIIGKRDEIFGSE